MNSRLARIQALVAGAVFAAPAACLFAQANPDLPPPQAREKSVAAARGVVASREKPAPLPSPLPNPFVAKEAEAPAVPAPAVAQPTAPAVSGAELLARLAARIPSTGTVVLGGQPILLLGQKRLNVGDTYSVVLEGQTYELTLAAVSSTSFTVKRGETLHTRPIRMPATSTTPRP